MNQSGSDTLAGDAPAGPAARWRLRRNCCLPPTRLLGLACAFPLVACVPGLVLLALGFPWVALFALVQAAGIAVAVLVYGIHATDGEDVSVSEGRLRVAASDGTRSTVQSWPTTSVRLLRQDGAGDDDVVLLAGGGTVRVGRHVDAARRARFRRQLLRALQGDRAGP